MTRETTSAALRSDVRTLFGFGVVRDASDRQLLESFLTADHLEAEAAFTVLVERHGPMVLQVCQQVLSDPHDAQDAFQATFLVLLRRAQSIRKRDSLASWLFGVAMRVARQARYAAIARRFHERHAGKRVAALSRAGDENTDSLAVLNEEIARLPDRYREPIVLCHLEGLSTASAAQRLGCAQGTILSRLARGRERLRRRLSQRAPGELASLLACTGIRGDAATSLPAALINCAIRQVVSAFSGREALPAASTPSVAMLTQSTLRSQFMTRIMFSGIWVAAAAATTLIAIPILRPSLTAGFQGAPSGEKSPQRRAKSPSKRPSPEELAAIVATGKRVPMLSDQALTLAYSSDGMTLASAGLDGVVHLWDMAGAKEVAKLKGANGPVRAVSFGPGGKTLACVSYTGSVTLWDVPTGTLRQTFAGISDSVRQVAPRNFVLDAIAFAPDGEMLAVAGEGQINAGTLGYIFEVKMLELPSGELRWSHVGRGEGAESLAFSPDGATLASAGWGPVKLWNAQTGEPLRSLSPARGAISSVAFAPDGHTVVGGGVVGPVGPNGEQPPGMTTLWDLASGRILRTLEGQTRLVRTVAVAPDGKTIASGGWGTVRQFGNIPRTVSEVRLWDLATGGLLWTFEGQRGDANSLAFAPDGKTLVYCDQDGVGVIDTETGKLERTLTKTTLTPRKP